jgi:hypothetical protein
MKIQGRRLDSRTGNRQRPRSFRADRGSASHRRALRRGAPRRAPAPPDQGGVETRFDDLQPTQSPSRWRPPRPLRSSGGELQSHGTDAGNDDPLCVTSEWEWGSTRYLGGLLRRPRRTLLEFEFRISNFEFAVPKLYRPTGTSNRRGAVVEGLVARTARARSPEVPGIPT